MHTVGEEPMSTSLRAATRPVLMGNNDGVAVPLSLLLRADEVIE